MAGVSVGRLQCEHSLQVETIGNIYDGYWFRNTRSPLKSPNSFSDVACSQCAAMTSDEHQAFSRNVSLRLSSWKMGG